MNKNKIYVDMNGRLGNQMFQYAFARKLYSIVPSDFIFDFRNVISKGEVLDSADSFVDCLCHFNVLPYKSVNENGFEIKIHGSKKQKAMLNRYYFYRKWLLHFRLKMLMQKYQYKMQKNGIYKEDEFKLKIYRKYKHNLFVKGYFENPDYFGDLREILLKEFTPKQPESKKNIFLYDVIKSKESVCVSVRVWNEIANNEELVKQRDVCTKDYYLKAIAKLLELKKDAVFIIFSNDIAFVKKNHLFSSINNPVYYEDGTDDVYEKLRLMYSCKHFIISTSTFSWWAQYLSRNPQKIVISPDRWFMNKKDSRLLSDRWVKICVNDD